ncbi:unnamed protein product [Euphydryas editha]|uniref:Uncharacterized protein n=1 Tax=Euphydryas editha TaxID=104508 RepID=A0AAU9VC57_EUPED|nr:unnamed protein product [Euphydryas editha]
MKFVLVFNIVLHTQIILSIEESFNYEKLNKFGLGKRIFYRRNNKYEYPEELQTKRPAPYVRSPYRNVYQGIRNKGDIRVYNKKFAYPPQASGHKLVCKGIFDCTLTHVAVETNGSIPIIFRGGVGYKYFTVIIRADPGDELSGRVRAYCARVLYNDTR